MSKETIAELQKQTAEKAIWFQWFSDYREFYCTANQLLLDEWLTQNLKPLTLESLDEALESCKSRLARRATSTQQISVPVAAPVVEIDETEIPPNLTRRVLVKMERTDFRNLVKKYGVETVNERLREEK